MKKILVVCLLLWSGVAMGQAGITVPGDAAPRKSFNQVLRYWGGAFHYVLDRDSAKLVNDLLYQPILGGTGLVKSTGGTISYVTDNSTNWNTAYGWGNHAGLYPTYNGTGATGTWPIGVTGNSGTVTNGVYTTTFNGLGDARYLQLTGGTLSGLLTGTAIKLGTTNVTPLSGTLATNDITLSAVTGAYPRLFFYRDSSVAGFSKPVFAIIRNNDAISGNRGGQDVIFGSYNNIGDPLSFLETARFYRTGSVRFSYPMINTQTNAGVAGTDSILVKDAATKEIRRISPTFYQNDTATFVPKQWASGKYTIAGNRIGTGLWEFKGSDASTSRAYFGTAGLTPAGGEAQFSDTFPQIFFEAKGGAANNKLWDFLIGSNTFSIRAPNDANSSAGTAMQITRSGATITNVSFPSGAVSVSGNLSASLPAYSSGTNLPVVYNSTNSRFETSTSIPSYAEGTWTPTLSTGGGSGGGYYTKTGNLVRAYFSVSIPSNASATSFSILGLPFTNSTTTIGSVIISGTDIGTPITGYVPSNTTNILFKDFSNITITELQFSSKLIYGTAIYNTTN